MSGLLRLGLVAVVLLVPMGVSAHRRPPPPPPHGGTSSGGAADMDELMDSGDSATSAGPTLGARARIAPDPGLDAATFRGALQATHGDLEQCMAASGLTGTMRVTARVALSHALALDIAAPRHDGATTQCAELVLRRALTAIAGRPLSRPLRASLTVRRREPRAPRVPPPAPPARADLAAFEGPVHAAIERDRAAMLSCLSSAAPGLVGNATLRLTLAPDGSLTLASARLPTGVPAGPALPCLSSRIAQLRFSPAPPRSFAIEHTLPLGL